ncbi:MAG: tRNA (adenosine(37)-N6)-threonylcarbamoyltransferase complex dimerization subunit type 1 TsaB [Eubacteriales bacterium]|nr:tRNA (adenosine(37)-N6)-threonylcarbamoyltransferase complex dimerization subunit type 1 TsaB [Eubacteriales bacterium]MDD3880882.1 tRNA (adenosine(37)-N6)-threonylcarbamoyltransferase complex dimerization subunit type 1 TsaB [Eubacteriales bacterium]MDD4511751.1 tRNA (adenosine(37)-N6)-threonylcarbamoyltransferase complex dimerization subunit type 1 TsaB [Eubacteriales bacterium]
MICLAVDTSGAVAGVAVADESSVLYENTLLCGKNHSLTIMPMIDEALKRLSLTTGDIGLFVCVVGPGSFTGVRIGVSTVKGLAHGAGKPCAAVSSLETLCQNAPYFDGIVCPMLDARAGQVYAAAYKNGREYLAPAAQRLEDFIAALPTDGKCLLLGDGALSLREKAAELLGERAVFAAPEHSFIRPSAAARIALLNPERHTDYMRLEPLYLRLPQAERERIKRESKAE